MSKHIAIKCTYNDGDEGKFVGFHGTCSNKNIEMNIKSGRVWCNQPECQCNEFYYNSYSGDKPFNPCYESMLFKNWLYGAGVHHTGERAGEPIHILNAAEGRIAILTTRFPGDKEEDRKIIGFFKITRIDSLKYEETFLYGDETVGMRLPLDIANKLYFWRYHTTKGGAKWGTGLFRYLDNEPVAEILFDLSQSITDVDKKSMITNIIKCDLAPNRILREKRI